MKPMAKAKKTKKSEKLEKRFKKNNSGDKAVYLKIRASIAISTEGLCLFFFSDNFLGLGVLAYDITLRNIESGEKFKQTFEVSFADAVPVLAFYGQDFHLS